MTDTLTEEPMFSCTDDICQTECSYPANMLRTAAEGPYCECCWEEQNSGTDWSELPAFVPEYVKRIQALQAERDKAVEARSKRDWQCGYLVALGTLIHLERGPCTYSEEMLDASGITREEANSLGLTDFDMDGINEQFDEIETRDADAPNMTEETPGCAQIMETSGYAEDHLKPEPEITQEQWDQLKADGPKPTGPLTPATEDGFAPAAALSQPFVMTEEWCMKMAKLEDGCEIDAGMPDHPLRTGTTHCEAGCKYGVESTHSDHCNSSLGNVIDAPAADSGLVDEVENLEVWTSFGGEPSSPIQYIRVSIELRDRIRAALRSPDRELLRAFEDMRFCADQSITGGEREVLRGMYSEAYLKFVMALDARGMTPDQAQAELARLESGGE